MNKKELLGYTGSFQQEAYARRICYDEGRARGLNAVEVKNGPLRFVVMLDKCLDVSEMSWRGIQMNFLSKPGLNGRNPFDTHGSEAQRSIMGGLFFTCGLENICAPFTAADGRDYPMHGRMRTSPAEHVSLEAFWNENDEYVINVSGDIREAELFGENLLLRRTVSTVYGDPTIYVKDTVINEGFRSEPIMLMYHCNLGYPFLTEDTRLILPSMEIVPRDEISSQNVSRWTQMDTPKENEPEYVFLHKLASDENGESFAAAYNEDLEIGLSITWPHDSLPYFGQWKSTASGDYVMGLEPGNSPVYGRAYCEERGILPLLAAQESISHTLRFSVFEGKKEACGYDTAADRLLHKK